MYTDVAIENGSMLTIKVYTIKWPEDRADSTKYEMSLSGVKILFFKTNETYRDFYPNLKKDTWEIDGTTLQLMLGMQVF